ncbi:MAG: cation-translocating P-type ATPase [Candidatus Korarchaeota archaeon]|nr:cation-translocating P-type ATPase [Candidatus Korarchaeota archaeon]
MIKEAPYALPPSKVVELLKTDPERGLTSEEAERRLAQFGYNELKEEKRRTILKMIIEQFTDPFVIILLVAILIAAFVERSVVDAATIAIIVILNAIIGFIQEYRAEKAIEALKQMAAPKARVLRDGQIQHIDSKLVVPGDILILEEGDKIAADARLLEAINLTTNEAILTGESTPVSKKVDTLPEDTPVADRKNMVFMATYVNRGRGKAVVVGTGMNTEFGKIAEMVQEIEEEETPLKRKMAVFAKKLGIIVIVLSAVIFVLEVIEEIRHLGNIINAAVEALMISVALAVSVVPEGLPAVLTVTLALGARNLARRNAIIRKLSSAEALGSTTVICSDKTGTITKGEMTVRKIIVNNEIIDVTGVGFEPKGEFFKENGEKIDPRAHKELELILKIGSLCTNAEYNNGKIIGDPTEGAILVAAIKAGMKRSELEKELPRVGEIPFSSERKMMTTIHKSTNSLLLAVKGAPEIIINNSSKIYKNGNVVEFTWDEKKEILEKSNELAKNGLRLLGFAYKEITENRDPSAIDESEEKELIFIGLMAMIDPPREEVYDAVKIAKKAGIKIVMVTGDHRLTAEAISREIGIMSEGDISLTGKELSEMSDEEFEKIVEKVTVYARVSPEHKLKIVEALKKKGHIVAMTGDGVNDAPALKRADIGIAMGISGTDVTKEAADMILADDNFATIVNAVEGGREIYQNIRKFVRFLLACNFDELVVIGLSAVLGWPIPLTAAMILWINLVTDGAPAVALAVDPPDEDLMDRPPRNPQEGILHGMTAFILVSFILQSIGTLLVFSYSYFILKEPLEEARTMAFIQAAFFELFVVWNCRSDKHNVFHLGVKGNRFLLISVVVSAILTGLLPYIEITRVAFGLAVPTLLDWVILLSVAAWGLFVFPDRLIGKKIWKWE